MRYVRDFFSFLKDLIKSKDMIIELTKKDFRTKYVGSYLGVVWTFIQPMITILVFWFVFQVGFRAKPVGNYPYILWLVTGLVPWFFFSECIMTSMNSIIENSFLVKKVVFRVSVLPIVKILSALIVHLFFIVVLYIMFLLYGQRPSIYHIQILYYLLATIFLVLSISWITSSIILFFRDLGQIIAIVLQFFIWLTPILWSIQMIPLKYQSLFKLNPLYYIIEGYRNAMIDHKWFINSQVNQTIYFWSLSFFLFVAGAIIFRKLRPHFADVL